MTDVYDTVASKLHFLPDAASVLTYCDGLYAASHAEVARFAQHRWITVYWDWQHAGAIDFEAGNPAFAGTRLRAYVAGRSRLGKRARVYCNRSSVGRAKTELDGHGYQWEWWIATLDGDSSWTPGKLAESIRSEYGVSIDPAAVWGCQWRGGINAQADESILFREW